MKSLDYLECKMSVVKTEYQNLIDSLIKDGYLKMPEIIEAFKAIDRADFVPETKAKRILTRLCRLISAKQFQPLTVAFMLELLEPEAGRKNFGYRRRLGLGQRYFGLYSFSIGRS